MKKSIVLIFEVDESASGSISKSFGKTHEEFLKSIAEALEYLDKAKITSFVHGLIALLTNRCISGNDMMILAIRGFQAVVNELMSNRAMKSGLPPLNMPSFLRAIIGELEKLEGIEKGGLIIEMGNIGDLDTLKEYSEKGFFEDIKRLSEDEGKGDNQPEDDD